MADYTKKQPHPSQRITKGQIGEIMGGKPVNDNDEDDIQGGNGSAACPDCSSGNVASTQMETTNINGGKGVMVTHRHHEKPRGKDEGYKEPTTHRHTFTDHNSFANHFKGHFSGSGSQSE